jgi:hypothetical protein
MPILIEIRSETCKLNEQRMKYIFNNPSYDTNLIIRLKISANNYLPNGKFDYTFSAKHAVVEYKKKSLLFRKLISA